MGYYGSLITLGKFIVWTIEIIATSGPFSGLKQTWWCLVWIWNHYDYVTGFLVYLFFHGRTNIAKYIKKHTNTSLWVTMNHYNQACHQQILYTATPSKKQQNWLYPTLTLQNRQTIVTPRPMQMDHFPWQLQRQWNCSVEPAKRHPLGAPSCRTLQGRECQPPNGHRDVAGFQQAQLHFNRLQSTSWCSNYTVVKRFFRFYGEYLMVNGYIKT